MEKEQQLPLEYIIKESTHKVRHSPAIFMLHGYGSNEDDLFSFADELPDEYTIVSIRAPHILSGFGYAWYAINFDEEQGKWSDNEQALKSRDIIVDFIDEVCKKYKIDTKNVTLLGFSQGAILSMAIALTYPRKVKNVIALSGYINRDIIELSDTVKKYSALHIYVSHGISNQVIPIEWARKTPVFLEELSIDYTFEEFPVGHGVSPQNFYSFRDWLAKHT